jgi:sec-independent protein translocase protein TatA
VSGGELVLVIVIALLAFGARGLPDAGRSLGRGLREFQRALNEARRSMNEERPSPRRPAAQAGRGRLID